VPIYEFRCGSCGTRFEELVARDASAACPSCGSREVERLLSQVFPTPKIGLRGRAAKRSDTARADRAEKRRERAASEGERGKRG
jgi:putative FmdB family regulatory protein